MKELRVKDIVIGHNYHVYGSPPPYWFFKATKILKPHQGINIKSYTLVEGEWTSSKDGLVGVIRHFRPRDLLETDKK